MSGETFVVAVIGPSIVAAIAAIAAIASARNARSPYAALADRVVHLEERVEELELQLRDQQEAADASARRFRDRIHLLLNHIDALTQYAEALIDLIRLNHFARELPKPPELPAEARQDI